MIVLRTLTDKLLVADGQMQKTVALCALDVLPVSGDGWRNRLDACVVEEIGVITPDQWNALTHLVAEDEVELENKLAGRQQTTWLK